MDWILVRGIGFFAILTIVIGIWLDHTNRKMVVKNEALPGGFKSRVLAFELVKSPDDAVKILNDGDRDYRELIREAIIKDFFFIPAYGMVFIALAVLFARRDFPGAFWLGAAAAVFALGTVAFDVMENYYILQTIGADPITQQTIDSMYRASVIKWACSFAWAALLSLMFLWRRDFPAFSEYYLFAIAVGSILIGLLLLASAIAGFIGLYDHPLIARSLALSFLGMPLLTLIFLIAPRQFLEGR